MPPMSPCAQRPLEEKNFPLTQLNYYFFLFQIPLYTAENFEFQPLLKLLS